MKKLIYSLSILWVVVLFACATEDSITPSDELEKPPYDLPRGEEGSLEELIYTVYEKYGSFVLYDFQPNDLYTNWTNRNEYWYVPVQTENREYVRQMLNFLLNDAFTEYPDEFIARYLPSKIFLVDSICSQATYNPRNLTSVLLLNNHGMAVSHVGEVLNDWDETDWDEMREELVGGVMGQIYDALEVPQEFFDIIGRYYTVYFYEDDPEEEFDMYEYSWYIEGFVGGNDLMGVYYMPHRDNLDLKDYLVFLMSTPRSKMDRIFARFDLVKRRAFVVAEFMKEQMEMDPVELQNSKCPADPLPADYFDVSK